jgi:hypothetical protein
VPLLPPIEKLGDRLGSAGKVIGRQIADTIAAITEFVVFRTRATGAGAAKAKGIKKLSGAVAGLAFNMSSIFQQTHAVALWALHHS